MKETSGSLEKSVYTLFVTYLSFATLDLVPLINNYLSTHFQSGKCKIIYCAIEATIFFDISEIKTFVHRLISTWRSVSLSEDISINLEVWIRHLRSFHFSFVSMCSAVLVCMWFTTRRNAHKIAGRVKDALTLQASHVLNASWDYGVQYPATGGGRGGGGDEGFNTQVQLVVGTRIFRVACSSKGWY